MTEEQKRLFTAHGFAMYRAQLLEQRLWAVLSTAYGEVPALIPPEVMQRIKQQSPHTFTRLIRKLEKTELASDDLLEDLRGRLADRDYIVHRFFWTHGEDIVNKERREFLIEELNRIAERFRQSNDKLRAVYLAWLVKRGIPAAKIAEHLAEKRAQVTIT